MTENPYEPPKSRDVPPVRASRLPWRLIKVATGVIFILGVGVALLGSVKLSILLIFTGFAVLFFLAMLLMAIDSVRRR